MTTFLKQLPMNKAHNYFKEIKTTPNEHKNIFHKEMRQLINKVIKRRI